jgi:hypothetical protein
MEATWGSLHTDRCVCWCGSQLSVIDAYLVDHDVLFTTLDNEGMRARGQAEDFGGVLIDVGCAIAAPSCGPVYVAIGNGNIPGHCLVVGLAVNVEEDRVAAKIWC